VFPVDGRPRDGTFYYIPLVATKDIDPGDEVRLDYGPYYERSASTIAPAEPAPSGQEPPLAGLLAPLL
jgi:hypothetical protein